MCIIQQIIYQWLKKYELATYGCHELNYNHIALGHLPVSVINDFTIWTILNSPQENDNTPGPIYFVNWKKNLKKADENHDTPGVIYFGNLICQL